MNDQANRIYRTGDGVVGGVCGGVARYAHMDAGVVRLFTALLGVLSAGLAALVYVGLWLALPQESDVDRTVDVNPDSILSDTYGQVVTGVTGPLYKAPSATAGHTPPPAPPVVPSAAAFGRQASFAPSIDQVLEVPGAGQAGNRRSGRVVWAALALGIVVAVAGMSLVLSTVADGFAPQQFWPLALVACGIARMVIPAADSTRTMPIVVGLVLCSVGTVLLLESLGVVHARISDWLADAAPLLLIMLGLFIVGKASDAPALLMLGAVVFALFCVIGLAFYTDEGPARDVNINLPMQQGSVLVWRAP